MFINRSAFYISGKAEAVAERKHPWHLRLKACLSYLINDRTDILNVYYRDLVIMK